MFSTQLGACLIFFILMFHSGCLHVQLGEKPISHGSIISKVFYQQDLNEEYKWKAVFVQTSCSLLSLCLFSSFFQGVSSFLFHSRKATKPEGPHLHKHIL